MSSKDHTRQKKEESFAAVKPSLLTRLTELPHLWCMYNFSVTILIVMWMHVSLAEYFVKGRINFGIRLLFVAFEDVLTAFRGWVVLQLMVLLLYPLVKLWTNGKNVLHKTGFERIWDVLNASGYAIFQSTLLFYGGYVRISHNLPIGSSLFILSETVRFMLKSHAFTKSASSESSPLSFKSYVYFLFAPTLIYKVSYPRNEKIRRNIVLYHLAEVVLCITFLCCLSESFGVYYFSGIGINNGGIPFSRLILYLFDCSLAGTLGFVYGFYLVLHAWQNMFAEILTFADRQSFYQDWWTQDNHRTLLKGLNTMIYQWTDTYIQEDLKKWTNNKVASYICMIFPVIIYQLIASLTLGSSLPIFLIVYMVLSSLGTFIDKIRGNIFVWTALVTSNGILWIFFCMEYYSRTNCPAVNDDLSPAIDFLLPKLWTCSNDILV